VTGDCHARFYERRRVKLPPPTHHREFEKMGWQVRMNGGVPEWLPPAWIDAARTPVTNRSHDPQLT
jgi:hypothetical protein